MRLRPFTATTAFLTAVLIIVGSAEAQTATLTTLHEFKGPPDGANPLGGLVSDGEVLYGTTVGGGIIDDNEAPNGCGIVYSLTPPASAGQPWTENIIHAFAGGSDGCSPSSGVVIGSGGVLYGTISNASSSFSGGAVFSLTPPAAPGGLWTKTILHTFAGCPNDAVAPSGVTIGGGGVLYGDSFYGGANSCLPPNGAGLGAVFSLTPPVSPGGAWTEDVYSIGGALDGPGVGVTVGSGEVLYAGTVYGGKYCCGALFTLVPPQSPGGDWTQPVIHSFGNPRFKDDGQHPDGNVVIDSSGVLYGTTSGGGLGNGEFYSLAPPASPGGDWTYTVLYDPPSSSNGSPNQLTLGKRGVLYATFSHGGASFEGTIFSLTPPASAGGSWTETTLYTFTGGSGAYPNGGLLIGPAGLLYGTTAGLHATPPNVGTVFSLKP
jgi:hypothetical protein